MNKNYIVIGLLTFVLGYAASADAQDLAQSPGKNVNPVEAAAPGNMKTFGTTGLSVETLSATSFAPLELTDLNSIVAIDDFGRSCTLGLPGVLDCTLVGSFSLPTGTIIESMEVDYSITGALGAPASISFDLQQCADLGSCVSLGSISANGVTPRTLEDVQIGAVVDGSSQRYLVVATMTPDVALLAQPNFYSVRLYYRRQVSPAPATATFDDVPPSSIYFRFIEALVASGITSGCSTNPPLYCPDQPVTRKEMAVFLAEGLGLYFPN